MSNLISVIVPVYNAEEHLERCLRSVLRQDYGKLELICIDDASADASASIISRLQADSPDLRSLTLSRNGGVSVARNAGLEAASGDLVCFVDADDELPPKALSVLAAAIEREGCDVAIGKFSSEKGGGWVSSDSLGYDGRIDRDGFVEIMTDYLARPVGNSIFTHCWGKLYRKNLIDSANLRFRTDMHIYEDIDFVAKYFVQARTAVVIQDDVYCHRESEGLGRRIDRNTCNFVIPLTTLHDGLSETTSAELNEQRLEQGIRYFAVKTLILSGGGPVSRIRSVVENLLSNEQVRDALYASPVTTPKNVFVRTGCLLRLPLPHYFIKLGYYLNLLLTHVVAGGRRYRATS